MTLECYNAKDWALIAWSLMFTGFAAAVVGFIVAPKLWARVVWWTRLSNGRARSGR